MGTPQSWSYPPGLAPGWPSALSPWRLAEGPWPDLCPDRIITHCPHSGLSPSRRFQPLSVPPFCQLLDTSRALVPLSVQKGHPRFLSQTNKQMPQGQTRGRVVATGPRGVTGLCGQEWPSQPFAFLCPHFNVSFWGPRGRGPGGKQFEEETSTPPLRRL